MRLGAYAGTSAIAAAGALLKAFHQRPNFYSATVYLSQSNACILILTNWALVCACTFMYGLQRLFYGPLRPIEVEQLSEKAWYAVLDTLLAMPALRDDVGLWMIAIFVLLLAGKVWSWIAEGRVDILEQQPPANPRLFHARLASSLLFSMAFDASMFYFCVQSVLDHPGPGMMLIFTFEFAILTIFSIFATSRYILTLCETRIISLQTKAKIEERKAEIRTERERLEQEAQSSGTATPTLPSEEDIDENEIDVPGWEEKRRWLFGLEILTDFIKIIVYTVFFTISLAFIGLPMHIMRDVYLTFVSLSKRLSDYAAYRKATKDMETRYQDATAEDLSNDNTCIVCREAMVPWEATNATDAGRTSRTLREQQRAKKLPCGHILHLRCLKAWLERQQACPTCRRPVVGNNQSNAAARPGIPGAPAANALGAPNQQPGGAPGAHGAPAQRQQPQNRLRTLNLGPLRIAFYNGPANQLPDALRGNQRTRTTAEDASGAAHRAIEAINTQRQLREIEESLVREAQMLNLEQSQYATVRALEAELRRLRALHARQQLGFGSNQGGDAGPVPGPGVQFQQGLHNPMVAQQLQPLQPQPLPTFGHGHPQAFQPQAGQMPLANGGVDLPAGLTLPEGWSLMPLQRIGGPAPSVSSQNVPHPTGTPTPAPTQFDGASTVPTHPATNVPLPEPTPTQQPAAAQQEPSQTLNGQTEPSTESQEQPTVSLNAVENEIAPHSTGPAAWGATDWNFDAPDTSAPSSEAQGDSAEGKSDLQIHSNGHAPEGSGEEKRDKGKGRAVQVEEVEDSQE